MRLLDFIARQPPDTIRRLSRIRIEPRAGHSSATLHMAGMVPLQPVGLHDAGKTERPIPRSPVSAGDTRGMADRNPPVTMLGWVAIEDINGVIDTADLDGQIAELDASGIVGNLHVDRRSGLALVVSTHAATQEERNVWLKEINT